MKMEKFEKREKIEEDKKKEQESAEAISGLKMCINLGIQEKIKKNLSQPVTHTVFKNFFTILSRCKKEYATAKDFCILI